MRNCCNCDYWIELVGKKGVGYCQKLDKYTKYYECCRYYKNTPIDKKEVEEIISDLKEI